MGGIRTARLRRGGLLLATALLVVSCALLVVPAQFTRALAQGTSVDPATTVAMYKGSPTNRGNYAHETALTPGSVNTSNFGRLASYLVDGQVYAQPLYIPNVTTAAGTYNLVIVATEHDSVYAFDADHAKAAPVWHTTFLTGGATSVPARDVYPGSYIDISPEIGITSTPTIDTTTGTIYISALTKENGTYVYRLHALDLTTGQDKLTPTVLSASVPGTGLGSSGGKLAFNAKTENQRAGLLLLNGTIYLAFASFADTEPYHGWILGYSAATLKQTVAYAATADDEGGGIWGAGGGLAADVASGNIYTPTGDGGFDLNSGGDLAGDTLLNFSTGSGLKIADYFAPFNQQCLDVDDKDLGSSGPMLLPTQSGASHPNEIVLGGKEGRIYVLDRDNLGKFVSVSNPCSQASNTTYDHVVQELPVGTVGTGGIFSTAAYWNGNVYIGGNGDALKAFSWTNGLLSTSATSKTPESFAYPGTNPVISSNGDAADSGIVWIIAPPATCQVNDHCNPTSGGTLRAYDANDLSNELYSSSQNTARDGLSSYVKFSVPTVANGEVFVGTGNSLDIFGLNPPSAPTPTPTATGTPTPPPTGTPTPTTYNNVGISDDTAPAKASFDGSASYSAQALKTVGIVPGAAIPLNGAQFVWPNVAAGANDNWVTNGQVLPITPLPQARTLAFLGASSNGMRSGYGLITYTDGTQQPYLLTLSDWTLSGGLATPLYNNLVAFSTNYRNTPTGKQVTSTYVFYADVALMPGKTIKSVTLPITSGLHIFSVATTAAVSATYAQPPANNVGTSDDAHPSAGKFDGTNSYSLQALQKAGASAGSPFTFNGAVFTWPGAPAGQNNNYIASGQVLVPPPTFQGGRLAFLGASTNGAHSGTAIVTYADGSQQTFTLGFSDWTLGGGKSSPLSSNKVAMKMSYRDTPKGKQTVNTYIFYLDVGVKNTIVTSVTLPNVSGLHIFAMGLKGQMPYNNVGISSDATTLFGNFDGSNSYSAQALQAAGITPGKSFASNGVTFAWPNVPGGGYNDYECVGQVFGVTPVSGATTLGFLGAANNGVRSGTATILYTDGTRQTFTLGFSDWTLGGGKSAPLTNNKIAITTGYRNTPNGPQTVKTYVFYTGVTLLKGKTISGVILPNTFGLHVFAIGTK